MVEASILARVLGIRFLTLDATVVLVPADGGVPLSAPHDPSRGTAARVGVPRSLGAGRRLGEAVRSLNEGAELLAQARRSL